jgi:hypothetical protein
MPDMLLYEMGVLLRKGGEVDLQLVREYLLNEASGNTFADSIGSQDGTWVNNPTVVAGTEGNARQFNGTNQYGTTPSYPITGNAFSVAIDIKTISPSNNDTILGQGQGTPDTAWFVRHITGNKLFFGFLDTVRAYNFDVPYTPSVSSVVAFTYDGSKTSAGINIYIDTVKQSPVFSFDAPTAASVGTGLMNVARDTRGILYCPCILDRIRFANVEWDQSQVNFLQDNP